MAERTRTANRAANHLFRNEVLLYLHLAGFPQAHRRPEFKRLSERIREQEDQGDILGLPWTLGVRNERTMDLSGAQDEVRREAARARSDLYASIQRRRGRTVAESYVTMPLEVFVSVLARLHPEALAGHQDGAA